MADTADKTEYRLYALRSGDLPSDAEFYFLLPDIDLIYTTEKIENAVEVTKPEQLPEETRRWLLETIDTITERYLQENRETILDGTKTFMDRFRDELEKERKRTATIKPVKVRAVKHGS